MAQQRRIYRVAERIQEIVASELFRCHDPGLQLVTITSVKMSPDLRHSKIYWQVNGGEARRTEAEAAFSRATSHFKRVVGDELGIRFVPELKFYYDDTFETGQRVEALLMKLNDEAASSSAASPEPEVESSQDES